MSFETDEKWKVIPGWLGLPVELDEVDGWIGPERPWLTWGTASVIAVVSIVSFTQGHDVIDDWGLIPRDPWRHHGLTFITSFFLHAGLWHLVGNLYFLVVFGGSVERYAGSWRWLLIIGTATLIGGGLDVAIQPASPLPLIGASGGISGLLVFYGLKFPHAQLGVAFRFFYVIVGWKEVSAWKLLLVWALLQVLGAGLQVTGQSHVAAIAHLGGGISQGATAAQIEAMLQKGAAVQPPEDRYISPLAVAVVNGKTDIAAALLNHGADPNWRGARSTLDSTLDFSALQRAIATRRTDCVSLLLHHGAKIEPTMVSTAVLNCGGDFPKDSAQQSFDIAKILADHGALELVPDERKGPLFSTACRVAREPALVQLFLDHGYSPNLIGSDLKTPVIEQVRRASEGKDSWPDEPQFKPILALLEAANKHASSDLAQPGVMISSGAGLVPPQQDAATESKPPIEFTVTFVEVAEQTYKKNTQEIDGGVRNGDLHFFENKPGSVWIAPTVSLKLKEGQPGWYSVGKVQSYIASASTKMQQGKPTTTLQANSIFYGVNADLSWSKDNHTLNTTCQITVPLGFDKLVPSPSIPADNLPDGALTTPRTHVTTFEDKEWDMKPGKTHGFWVGASYGWARIVSDPAINRGKLADLIKAESPTRLAVFVTAQSLADATLNSDPNAASAVSHTAIQPPVDIRVKEDAMTVRTYLVPTGDTATRLAAGDSTSPDGKERVVTDQLVNLGFKFPPGAHAIFFPNSNKLVVRNTPDQLDVIADFIGQLASSSGSNLTNLTLNADLPASASKPQVAINLEIAEIEDDVYLSNKDKIDEKIANDILGLISLFNRLKGVTLLSTPCVTVPPGVNATIDIVNSSPCPIVHAIANGIQPGPNSATPATQTGLSTKDFDVSAEITPSLAANGTAPNGSIILNGKFTITSFAGFIPSNLAGNSIMPSFSTSESYFAEALKDGATKGIWIPGEHVAQRNPTASNFAPNGQQTAPMVKKRYLLFVSASSVK
jgi:membrane associated rhomboid family serine protease